jgi:threonine dehydrogenase-like Zn-dependent dehydrogenase
LQTARQVGADHTLDLASCGPLADAVLAVTGGRSPDVVFEATGHPSSINAGLEVLRPEGIFVTAGIHAAPANFDVTAFVRKRQQLRAAHSSRRENWDRMARRVTQSPDDVRPFVSVSLGLTDALEAFGRAASRQVSKVILRPDAG